MREAGRFYACCSLLSRLLALPVPCPYRAVQATGFAGGYDCAKKTTHLGGGFIKAFTDEQSRRRGGSFVQRELAPVATEGLLYLSEIVTKHSISTRPVSVCARRVNGGLPYLSAVV